MRYGVPDSKDKVVQDQLNWYLDASQLRSYPGSGTTWTNLYRTGKNGTLVNSPVFVRSNGGYLRFDGYGGSSPYVDFGGNPGGNGIYSTTALSFCVWAYIPSSAYLYIGAMNIAFTGVYGGANYGAQMYYTSAGGVTQINWLVKRSAGDVTSLSSNISFYTIYNFVGSYDGTNLRLYVNGVKVGTSGTFSGTVFNASGASFGLAVNSGDQAPLAGNIYNAIMYNKALSDVEVLQNYNVQKTRFGL